MSKKEIKNDLDYLNDDIFDTDININPNILHLFKNFLIKENYQKNCFLKEIMPEYSDIESQIKKKINQVRYFYDIDPLFREMQSNNTFTMNLFRKGIRRMFFGPKGIVTKKSSDLKNYYKSFYSDIDLNSKIYAGSLDYYDFLSGYNSFFERLKSSRKKILKLSGNFAIANTTSDKLRAAYTEYTKKRKKNSILLKRNKNNIIEINKPNSINQKIDIKNKTENNFFNKTHSKYKSKKNISPLDKSKQSSEIKINKRNNIFLNYKKSTEYKKKNETLSKVRTSFKLSNKNSNKNSISIKTSENNIINISNIQKTEIYPNIRENKKYYTNKTTINDEDQNEDLTIISKPFLNPFNSPNINTKRKNTFVLNTPVKLLDDKNIKSDKNLRFSNSSKNKKKKKKIQIDNIDYNKSIKNSDSESLNIINTNNDNNINSNNINTPIKFKNNSKKKLTESIKELKLSLKKKINLTEPSNKEVEDSLNKFIFITTKDYDLKKMNLFNQKMEKELIDLKEVSKSIEKFNEMAKKVDFSDFKSFSPRDNQLIKIRKKPTSYNLAFSYKTRYLKNVPVREFIQSIDELKDKKKQKRLVKNIRAHVKNNFRVIHNLAINLEHLKKKYNYE